MFKKTLISLAVASSLGLTGCFSGSNDGGNANPDFKINNPAFTGKTWPVFNPLTGQIPVPSDLNFDQQAADGSFGVAGDMTNPVIAALNNLSGASTIAPAVVRLSGDIDASTVDSRAFIPNPAAGQEGQLPVIPNPNQNVFLIEVQYASGEPVRALSIGEPPTIPSAITFQVAAGQDPLGNGRDLSGRDQGAATAHLLELANSPAYDHDVLELDGDSAIRIRPNKPLNPLSRHVVVVTNGIKDINGEAIVASPAYQNLTDADQPVGNAALNPVRTLINSFWENIGTNYFALNNSSRAALGMPALTDSNIALSYSFTTSEDKKVLSHMANPANWISDQLRRSVTIGAASAAVKGGASDFATVFGAVGTALANFEPSVALKNAGLAPCDESPFTTPLGSFDDQFNCVGALVKFSLDGALAQAQLSFPQPQAIENIGINSTNDALSVSAVLSSLEVQPGQVDVHQGFIELPQYLAVPDSTQTGPTSTLRTVSWRPDAPLAAVLGEALGATIPQQDTNVSNVLNYNFPFPTLQGKVEVPMLVITPAGANPTTAEGDPLIPVIFQHGITTDRSAALAFGTQLVAAAKVAGLNLAVFAIDQPLHGVSPFTRDDQESLALTLLVQGGLAPAPAEDENGDPIIVPQVQATIDAIIARQFPGLTLQSIAFNTTGDAPVVQCEEALHEGISPSTERTFQQAVANVLSVEGNEIPQCGIEAAQSLGGAFSLDNTVANAGSTIPGLAAANTATGAVEGINERHYGFTAGPDGNPIAMNFESGVGSSGSLFINLTNFMNSRDVLRQGAIDLMNLTATVNSLDGVTKNGVTFIGHSLGTLNGGAFVGAATASGNPDLFVAGAHLLTPVAGTTRMLENSPSFAPTILGGLRAAAGLEQGDANLETFFYVNQAMLDSVDPINFADELAVSNTVLAQIAGDRTTPNAADVRFGEDNAPLNITFPNGVRIQSPAAPLSGSEALAFVMGATPTELPLNLPMITRYEGGVHGTPVLPLESIAEAGEVLKDRSIAAGGEVVTSAAEAQATFGTMIAQTIALIDTVNATLQD